MVEGKCEMAFDTPRHAKIWLSSNNLSISDGSAAADRRLNFISFKRRFESHEADHEFRYTLTKEQELSGIFNLLMDNLRMVKRRKEIRTGRKSIDQRVAKNAMIQDPIKYFVEIAPCL